jgi:hypothetical protein
MQRLVALGLLAAALVAPACLGSTAAGEAEAPVTKLTITSRLEGGKPGLKYTLTCGPARLVGLPAGRLTALDACRAVGLIGDRIYRPSLSVDVPDCDYVQAPRSVEIVGYRRARAVRTRAEVGACERLLVARATLERVVAWSAPDR